MKIAVNARLLRKNQMDGIGWFAYNTLKYIVEFNPNIEFHFFYDSGIEDEFLFGKNVTPHNLFPPAKHALLNLLWFEWSLKNSLKKINPDLLFSPDGILCLGWQGKQYGVIHDINFHHNPKDLKWSNRAYYNYVIPRSASLATRIGTVSEYSKQDLVNTYGIDPQKIDVVYNGVNNFFHPIDEEKKKSVKLLYSGGKEYFIYIGTLHPRKNILRLLQAFERFKSITKSDIKLLLAGKPLYQSGDIIHYHDKMFFKKDVQFLGHVDNVELNDLLGAAMGLTFVPYFEGFGIPIIEAFQCNVPVISANTTALPEVAGNAALYVNPFQVEDISNAMQKISSDEGLRKKLISEGSVRKSLFNWENTAHLLWNGIKYCLND